MERRALSPGGSRLEEVRERREGAAPHPAHRVLLPWVSGASLGYLVLMFLKSVSGNSLGLGFSHVYLEADVILCQSRGHQREKSHLN